MHNDENDLIDDVHDGLGKGKTSQTKILKQLHETATVVARGHHGGQFTLDSCLPTGLLAQRYMHVFSPFSVLEGLRLVCVLPPPLVAYPLQVVS